MALTFTVPDTELSATLANRRDQIMDNVFTGTPFLMAMTMQGGVRTGDGGNTLVTPLEFAKNTTIAAFACYDLFDTTPQETLTSASYNWANVGGTISISGEENAKNQGRHKLLSLLDHKISSAERSLRDSINIKLLAAQPGAAATKEPVSITELIDEAPTANPTRGTTPIGGIANSNTWWRNQATSGGAFTVADMNTMYNDVSDGSEPPKFLLTSQTVFEYYENSQVGMLRYADTRLADAGFEALAYKTRPLVWDPNIGNTDEIYFLNTDYFKITMMEGADFVTTDFVEPVNQWAKVAKVVVMLQLEATNRRRLGTLHGITAPA